MPIVFSLTSLSPEELWLFFKQVNQYADAKVRIDLDAQYPSWGAQKSLQKYLQEGPKPHDTIDRFHCFIKYFSLQNDVWGGYDVTVPAAMEEAYQRGEIAGRWFLSQQELRQANEADVRQKLDSEYNGHYISQGMLYQSELKTVEFSEPRSSGNAATLILQLTKQPPDSSMPPVTVTTTHPVPDLRQLAHNSKGDFKVSRNKLQKDGVEYTPTRRYRLDFEYLKSELSRAIHSYMCRHRDSDGNPLAAHARGLARAQQLQADIAAINDGPTGIRALIDALGTCFHSSGVWPLGVKPDSLISFLLNVLKYYDFNLRDFPKMPVLDSSANYTSADHDYTAVRRQVMKAIPAPVNAVKTTQKVATKDKATQEVAAKESGETAVQENEGQDEEGAVMVRLFTPADTLGSAPAMGPGTRPSAVDQRDMVVNNNTNNPKGG